MATTTFTAPYVPEGKIREAMDHVRSFFPDVRYVVYFPDQRWLYVDDALSPVNFAEKDIDVSLLEDAADSLEDCPAVFGLSEEEYYG